MYSEFKSFEELRDFVVNDKDAMGLDVFTRNRYPIRFVLFDNFRDCSNFVELVQSEFGAIVESVDKWLDPEYPDIMITHVELAERIKDFIRKMEGKDCVIAPFSELARFYDNDERRTFDTLLKTIKAIEASEVGFNNHQRVYVPIVGLEGKMETFSKDSQSTIWRLKTEAKDFSYRLILTNKKTFGVEGLEHHYTIVNTMREWLNVWKSADKQVTPNIISTSTSIFANAIYAQPDNAFSYVSCNDAYEFLTKGLQLQFGGLEKSAEDGDYWDELAEKIDVSKGFSFTNYVLDYFSIKHIDSYQAFIRLWLNNQGGFERWLLAKYYQIQSDANPVLARNLNALSSIIGNELIEKLALDMTEIETDIEVRKYCLTEAAKHHVKLREGVEATLSKRLQAIAEKYNEQSALKYFTGITEVERKLAISWYGKGKISADQIKPFFPDLYHYISEPVGISVGIPQWVSPYFEAYKKAKMGDTYTAEIAEKIKALNGSEVAFDGWYQEFSSVRTLLQNRGDIEVFYWIDGLGIEWVPLIKEIIREKNGQGIYLNEVKVARALLPTTTEINKVDLQKILPEGAVLHKEGDLDALAHQTTNVWPSTIIDEVEKVREVIEEIVSKYNGKKIAIISDHGLTYLSQKCEGLGLAGAESDHHGRLARKHKGGWTSDENYFRLEDGVTACALNHKSLCNKVPKGQGIHGGCTPEEVLVPIFVISNFVSGTEWTADILTTELTGVNPTLKFRIKNVPSTEMPYVMYDGVKYILHQQQGTDIFETSPIVVNNECNDVDLVIGSVTRYYNVDVATGAQEDDLFDGF